MSVRIMSLVFENQILSPTDKLIMLALADHANDEGKSIYPSQSSLSRKTGLARGTVNQHIQSLQEQGYLKKSRVRTDRSNVLELEITSKLADDLSTELSTDEPSGVTEDDTSNGQVSGRVTPGCHGELHPDVTEDDTNHHLNHHLNQKRGEVLLAFFEKTTDIPRPLEKIDPKQNARWMREVEKWVALEATEEDIVKAVERADQRGTTLSWPGSITAYLTSAVSRRKRKVKENPAENDWRKWLGKNSNDQDAESYKESWLGAGGGA